MALGDIAAFDVQALATLTAVGVTEAVEAYTQAITFQVTASSVGTNAVIRMEGSLDNAAFFNLDQSGADTTITVNGTYGFCLSGCPVRYVRLRLVSIGSGTPSIATIVGAL
jgi:hypothetical protein